MQIRKLCVIALLSIFVDYCVCQVYSASFEVERLLELEGKLLDSLTEYISRQKKHGMQFEPALISFLNDTRRKNHETNRDHDLDNPLATFHLLNRWVHGWNEVKENLTCTEEEGTVKGEEKCPILTGADVIQNLLKREKTVWPTSFDLKLAAEAILNVWNTHQLKIDDLVNGKLFHVREQALSADEIFYIANVAVEEDKLYEAITWFEFLVANLDRYEDIEFKTSTLYRRMASSYHLYGMTSKALKVLETYSKQDKEDKGIARDLAYFRSIGDKNEDKEFLRFQASDATRKTANRKRYESLCRGEENAEQIQLNCEILPLQNQYGVSKIEYLWSRPRIVRIYDAINRTEAAEIIGYGEKAFSGSGSKQLNLGTMIRSNHLCEGDSRYPLLTNVSVRLESITRLKIYPEARVPSSECYMLTNEAPGGTAVPSLDYWEHGSDLYPGAGNRMATVMLQLSDISAGGAMVFPRIGLSVKPVKGSAIVWWNLRQDGTPDKRSLHINCPTVVGSPWAAYKTFLYNNQMFRRPFERV